MLTEEELREVNEKVRADLPLPIDHEKMCQTALSKFFAKREFAKRQYIKEKEKEKRESVHQKKKEYATIQGSGNNH